MLVGSQHRANGLDCGIEPMRDLEIRDLQSTRARGFAVELIGEPGTICAERMNLPSELSLLAVALAASLDGRLKRIKCRVQPFGGSIDDGDLTHPRPHSRRAFGGTSDRRISCLHN
jgi:hypothetical protein